MDGGNARPQVVADEVVADEAIADDAVIDLYWLPLGAGQRVVRRSGRLYERWHAWRRRRPRCDLYHAALEVVTRGTRTVIELAPVPDRDGRSRGVVAQGPVGSRWLGRWRLFRYELRCWRDGQLPDREFAVASPQRLSASPDDVARVLGLLPEVPTLVWGRDEIGAGEMWNSNSVIAWLLVRSRLDGPALELPAGGRAPGWEAGLLLADRQERDPDPAAPGTPVG